MPFQLGNILNIHIHNIYSYIFIIYCIYILHIYKITLYAFSVGNVTKYEFSDKKM